MEQRAERPLRYRNLPHRRPILRLARHCQLNRGDFAPIAHKEIKTDDQDGNIITATYDSLAVFMQQNSLLQEAYVLQRAPDAAVASTS